MNPISAIRSASSRTTMPTSSKDNAFLFSKSKSLPGHATSISTPFSRPLSCFPYDVPPYTESTFIPESHASGSKTFLICSANSLVGVSISAVGFFGLAEPVREINGRPKASVFPEPVGALQQISLPSIALGIASI